MRAFAADDYKAIAEAMEALKSKPAPVPITDPPIVEVLPVRHPGPMTKDEQELVARLLNCHWPKNKNSNYPPRCGKQASWTCHNHGKCMYRP